MKSAQAYTIKFLNFSLFMWFWIFIHTKQGHKSKIKTKNKTMHIKRCMMHKCMIMKHLMHEGSYKDRKLDQGSKRAKAQP